MSNLKKSLELKSDLSNLVALDDFLNEINADGRMDEEKAAAVMLVLSEAATNAMLHGNKLNADLSIRIDAELNDTSLMLKITDKGDGFDPESVPDPLAEENLLKTSGRGVYLMREYAEEVSYNKKGNELSIRFAI